MTASRILVIDDSTTLRKLVEIAMRGSGIDVDFAATGTDGVIQARSARPDVILLDYVLPDLQSTEVCQLLSDDTATAQVPVVVMSANQASVFESFKLFPAVVDFVGKPFTPSEIRNRLETAIRKGPTAAPTAGPSGSRRGRSKRATAVPALAPAPPLPPAQLELATRALSRALSARLVDLAQTPLPEGIDPGPYYAARVLDPQTVSEVVAACMPLLESTASGDLQLRGILSSAAVLEVLRLLASSTATGTLVIELADTYRIHLRRGEPVMCTCSRFDEASLGTWAERVPPELLAQARRAQQTENKPALITLAHAGAARVAELPVALNRDGLRLLQEVLGATSGRFAWLPSMSLPDYVEAFGRPLAVTAVALARQRKAPPDLKVSSTFLEEVYDRTPRFSEKLAGAKLEPEEQRLLALIDGRASVRDILARVEIPSDRAAGIFDRLRHVDLIVREGTSAVVDVEGSIVAILDNDAGFVAALRTHLASRKTPVEVHVVERASDLAATVLKQRVRMVIINSRMCTAELIQDLAPVATVGTIELVAVVDAPRRADVDTMLEAGMHAVLVKPIHVNDLERLLTVP